MEEGEVVRKILLAILFFTLIVSLAGLYISANILIDVWAGTKYSPVYKVLLNAAMLLIAVYLIQRLIIRPKTSD
jgi:phage shock protein PspC (stress-responsive transcriptional regulator)